MSFLVNCSCQNNYQLFVMVSVIICFRSTFGEFSSKCGRDPRFRAVEKMHERELMFRDYMLELRRQEDVDSRGQIERVSDVTFSFSRVFIVL